MLIAALDTVTADLDRRLSKLTEGARDARSRLRAVIKGFLGLAEENRDFWLVFVTLWGEMMHDETLARFNAEVYRRYRRVLGLMVAEGLRSKVFRRVDPEEAGALILGVVDGISLQRMFDPHAFTLERATQFSTAAIERYLDKR